MARGGRLGRGKHDARAALCAVHASSCVTGALELKLELELELCSSCAAAATLRPASRPPGIPRVVGHGAPQASFRLRLRRRSGAAPTAGPPPAPAAAVARTAAHAVDSLAMRAS